ncbi:MAG TPA: DUF4012 domain-containing protein [Actinomycetota bacterium]
MTPGPIELVEAPPPDAEPPRRRGVLRWVLVAIAALLLLGILMVTATLLRMKGDLEQGRSLLLEARRELVDGRLEDAATAAGAAEIRFARAASTAGGPLGTLGALTPFFGGNVEAAEGIAVAGTHLAGAASDLAGSMASLPGGWDDLAPTGGRLPLEHYETLAASAAVALEESRAAEAVLADTPGSFLLPQVRDARWEAQHETATLTRSLEGATSLLRGFPTFAGDDGPRRYLVMAQNPAELRGTGGIWGAYAILTLEDGRPTLSSAAPTRDLADPALEDIEGISSDYRENYDVFGGAASWQNMNMTPDFPSAARAALANYEAGQGVALDGVLAADPFALEAMLSVTGPVPVPGTDVRVSATNVLPFTMNEAYTLFPRQIDRKSILGAVAGDVIGRFLALDGKGLPRLRALSNAIGGGHLLLYSTDPGFQSGLALSGAGGAFLDDAADAPGDVASVTVNNGSANKVDFYARTQTDYRVTLAPEGAATSELKVTLTNEAPTEGPPRYVLGPFVEGLEPGDARPLVSGWCHDACLLLDAERDGEPVGVNGGTEGGMGWFRDQRPIVAGETGTLWLHTQTQRAWQGDTSSGVYRLLFLTQPTANPTTARIEVVTPPGTTVVWSNHELATSGNVAVWTGTPPRRLELEVRFQAPALTRWWRNLTA